MALLLNFDWPRFTLKWGLADQWDRSKWVRWPFPYNSGPVREWWQLATGHLSLSLFLSVSDSDVIVLTCNISHVTHGYLNICCGNVWRLCALCGTVSRRRCRFRRWTMISFTSQKAVEGMWRSSDWLMAAGHTGQHLVILHFYYRHTRKMSAFKNNPLIFSVTQRCEMSTLRHLFQHIKTPLQSAKFAICDVILVFDIYWLWHQLSDISNPQRAVQRFSVLHDSCSFFFSTRAFTHIYSPAHTSPSLSVALRAG